LKILRSPAKIRKTVLCTLLLFLPALFAGAVDGMGPAASPVVTKSPRRYLFDSRELKRLKIAQSPLPEGPIVINSNGPLFEKYKSRILSVVSSGLIPLILAILLVVNYVRRKGVERTLRSRELLYKTFIAVSPYGIIVLDRQGYIVEMNAMVEEFFGLKRDAFTGRHLSALPLKGREFRDFRRRLVQEGMASGEFCYEESPRKYRHFFSRAVRLQEGGYIAYLTDITTRVEAGNALLEALHEKEMLIKEVHHRVKNNMQIIASLLEMQESDIDDDQAVYFRKSRARIKTIAMVHEQLISHKNTNYIELASLFHDITYARLGAVPGASRKVGVLLDVEPVSVDIDIAIPLALIINELVDNAFNHAFAKDSFGSLRISLDVVGEQINLEVQDSGSGISAAVMGDGMGLQIIRILCTQLRASLEFPPAKGLLARIQLSVPEVSRKKWMVAV